MVSLPTVSKCDNLFTAADEVGTVAVEELAAQRVACHRPRVVGYALWILPLLACQDAGGIDVLLLPKNLTLCRRSSSLGKRAQRSDPVFQVLFRQRRIGKLLHLMGHVLVAEGIQLRHRVEK